MTRPELSSPVSPSPTFVGRPRPLHPRTQSARLSAALWLGSILFGVTGCSSDAEVVGESDTAGDDEIVRLLLEFGAEPDIERSEPALVGAAASGSIEAIRMLVAAGVDVCVVSDDWGGTLQEIALAHGADDVAPLLAQLASDRC